MALLPISLAATVEPTICDRFGAMKVILLSTYSNMCSLISFRDSAYSNILIHIAVARVNRSYYLLLVIVKFINLKMTDQ